YTIYSGTAMASSSSVGNLIPLGQKPDKSSKKDDLTGGLISIGGKPKAAADDTLDDFDLDDLLNDTPKPSSKAPSSSPKKSRKSKDKARKKKKDKGNDLDDSTSPIKPSKSSFAFDDNEHDQASSRPAKPKTSMKNLDDEFAKALGFDESEFRSSATLDSPDKTPPSPVFQAPPPVPAPSPPLPVDKGAISASFFDDIPDNQANMHSPSQSLVDSRPRGGRGGRRSSSNDQDTLDPFGAKETLKPTDPFAKPSATPRHDPFGATTSATKQQDSTRPINQVESASDQSNEKTRLNLSVNPTSETDQVRSFPWMKPQDTATSAVVPSFPWMQAKRDHVADVVSPKFEDPPVKQTETKSDLPAFPWLKKKPAEVAISTTQLEAKIEPPSPIKTNDDMPAFPWTKTTPEAPDIPGQPPSSSLVVAEQLPPPVLAISKPDSPVRATLEIIPPDRSNDPSNAMTPPRHKDPSPRRPSPSPPKLSTSDLDIPPSLDLRNSPEKVVATLGVETERNAALTVDVASLRQNELALQDDLARVQTESAQRLDQLTSALSLSQEAAALRVQTLELGPLQALVAELQLENAALRGQVSTAQASLAASQRELVQEKSMHAQSVERFQRVQHDREQEALLQQRWQADEQRHAEKDALERLLTQVRAAVSGLKVLQENVVGSKSESEMRIWGENETRARVLVDMEGTCKAFMHRSQEECHRLQALLNAMEGTMRTLRGDHMEEKERLRSEQSRLDELAGHFQAQTTLLQERTDTNTRVVTQTLSAYIQDIRVAEARLHTRREQLLEEERQLHFARAAFAAQQEEALRDQRVAQEKLHMEQKRVEDKLHRVRHETNAFETLVHAHADEMNALAAYQVQLEHEKERLQNAATRVEHMAQQVRDASEHSAAMEAQAKDLMLLRQVSLELPFLARRGLIMDKWTAVARALVASDEFTRTDLDAKKANNRFNALIDSHRKHNKDSERASGVSEEVSEKVLLLDDLLAVFDDAKDEEAKRVVSTQKANQHIENLGSIVRDEAMMSLGKRKQACDVEGAVGGGSNKVVKMMAILNEQAKSDLEFKKEKHNSEIEERRQDRELLLGHIRQQNEGMQKQQELMQQQQETLLKLMSAIINKI
ncbi:hypothetical protein DYB34_008513, partial [Aphanomyces astaci]